MSFCRESTAGEGREAPAPRMHGNSTQFGGMSLSQENFHLNDCSVCRGVDESMRLRCEFSCIKEKKKKKLFNTWIYSTVNFNHRRLGGVPFSVFFFPPLHRQGGTHTAIPKERRLWVGTAAAPTTTDHSSFTPRAEETLCGVCKEPQSRSHRGRGRCRTWQTQANDSSACLRFGRPKPYAESIMEITAHSLCCQH